MWTLSNHIREFPAHLWSFSICLTLDVIITMMTWLCCGAGYIKSLKLCNSNQALQTLLLHASLNKHPWALVCSMAHGSSFTTVSWRALIMDHASTGHLGSCHFPHSNLSWPQAVPPLPPDWLITIKYGRVDTPHGVRMASRSFEGNWENICPVHVIPLTHNDAGGSTFLMGAVFKNKKTKTHRINNVLQSCGHGSSVWGWGAVRISPLSSVHRDVRRSPEWLHVLAPQSDNINNSLRSRRAGSPAAGSQAWHNFLREHWLNPPRQHKNCANMTDVKHCSTMHATVCARETVPKIYTTQSIIPAAQWLVSAGERGFQSEGPSCWELVCRLLCGKATRRALTI